MNYYTMNKIKVTNMNSGFGKINEKNIQIKTNDIHTRSRTCTRMRKERKRRKKESVDESISSLASRFFFFGDF